MEILYSKHAPVNQLNFYTKAKLQEGSFMTLECFCLFLNLKNEIFWNLKTKS